MILIIFARMCGRGKNRGIMHPSRRRRRRNKTRRHRYRHVGVYLMKFNRLSIGTYN